MLLSRTTAGTPENNFFFYFCRFPTFITWSLIGLSFFEYLHQIDLDHRSFSAALRPVHDRVSCPCTLHTLHTLVGPPSIFWLRAHFFRRTLILCYQDPEENFVTLST